MPFSHLQRLLGSAHLPGWDAAGDVARLIRDFLPLLLAPMAAPVRDDEVIDFRARLFAE
jgi:hypothetical protein